MPARRPQRKWGQNFLHNQGAVARIVAALEVRPGEPVLEIGPGKGALTGALLDAGHDLTAIEIDPDLVAALRTRFGERLSILHDDAVFAPLPDRPFVAVGNLPYNAGTPILRRVIADPHCRRAVFMLQKEVAERIVARPGDEAYGFLTLYVQLFADSRIVMTLEPGSFRPPPKVRSAVVLLDRVERVTQSDKATLVALISASFQMRRKKLTNNLTGPLGITKGEIENILETIGLPPDTRSETMSLGDFDRLAASIEPHAAARLRQNARPSALLSE